VFAGVDLGCREAGTRMDVEPGAENKLSIEKARLEIAGGDAVALDVRDEEDWSKAHVHGAIHVPRERLSSEIEGLEPDQRVIVFDDDDKGAREVAEKLRERGIDAVAAEGGIDSWISEDFNVQPTADPDEDTELGAG
jgi:rhodanese-related sulfurtransferase